MRIGIASATRVRLAITSATNPPYHPSTNPSPAPTPRRIVAISEQVRRDEDYPIQQYDRVLFNPKPAIPVDFEGDNRLFVVPVEDVVAVFRRDA